MNTHKTLSFKTSVAFLCSNGLLKQPIFCHAQHRESIVKHNPSFTYALVLAHSLCFSDIHSLGGLWYMLPFLVSSLSFGFSTHQDPDKCYPSQATDADSPFLLGNSSNLMSLLIVTSLFWRTKSWQPELSVTLLFQHITAGEKGNWFVLTQASLVLRDQEGGWQAAFGFFWQPAAGCPLWLGPSGCW